MHGIIPQAINKQGFISQSGLLQLAQAAAQFGISGGVADTVGSQGITPVPQLLDQCFAIIDDFDGNRHAWTELSLFDPDNPTRMVGGRYGTIDTDGSGSGGGVDNQVAWGLNGETYDIGTIVYVVRINYNAWGIVGGAGENLGSGGGDGTFYGSCPDGSFFYVRINGTHITVGDATHG